MYYSFGLIGAFSARLGREMMGPHPLAIGDCFYFGRLLLAVSLSRHLFRKLRRYAISPARWMTPDSGLLYDFGTHALALLYLPLESLRWLASTVPSMCPATVVTSADGLSTLVGALWLAWIPCRGLSLLLRKRWAVKAPWQSVAAKLLLDATLAINWLVPSLSLLQVGVFGTCSSALGLQEASGYASPAANQEA